MVHNQESILKKLIPVDLYTILLDSYETNLWSKLGKGRSDFGGSWCHDIKFKLCLFQEFKSSLLWIEVNCTS